MKTKRIISAFFAVVLITLFTAILYFQLSKINSPEHLIDGKITLLINDLTKNVQSQDAAITRLVAMGETAVPHVISHLGDMRPLATRQVTLPNNSPGARERFRTYEAEVVDDALSDVLNEITGEHSPTFQDGASLDQRLENRNRWVNWCRARYPQFGKICSDTGAMSANRATGK